MIFKFVIFAVLINSIAAINWLAAGSCLKHNEFLESTNGCFKLILQDDGNLVLYRKNGRLVSWSTGTQRSCTNRVCMQRDGNLVAYDCHDVAMWSTGTFYRGSHLVLQDDGNAVVYPIHDQRMALWASNTVSSC